MTLSACPRCGASRTGTQRFCATCGLDYWTAAQLGATAPPAATQQPAPAPPRSSGVGWIVGVFIALVVIGGGYSVFSGMVSDIESDVASELDGDPTDTPRPTRTARPTPEATTNSGALALGLFSLHVQDSSSDIAAGLQAVSDDATALDIDALVDSSVDLWVDLGVEVDWLAANPPHPCYADLHAAYTQAISEMHHALDVISDAAIYEDVDLMDEGAALMIAANDSINGATAHMESAATACGL